MLQVSHSKITLWRKCQKAYEYRYEQGLKRRLKSAPLVRGTIVGEMLAERARGKDMYKILAKYEAEFNKLFVEEREMYGNLIDDVRRIMEGYERKYDSEDLIYLDSEVEVKVSLGNEIEFIGKIDQLVRDKTGGIWVMERKNPKVIPTEEDRFSDIQTVVYVWARDLGVKKKSEKTRGVMWDYIRAKPPTIPERLKSGELTQRKDLDSDHFTYMEAIKEYGLKPADYKEALDRLQHRGNAFFERVVLPVKEDSLVKSVVTDLMVSANEILSAKGLENPCYPRNMTWMCPKQCEYFRLCNTELRGLDSEFIRKADYEVRLEDKGEQFERE